MPRSLEPDDDLTQQGLQPLIQGAPAIAEATQGRCQDLYSPSLPSKESSSFGLGTLTQGPACGDWSGEQYQDWGVGSAESGAWEAASPM